jgi:short-subunit dehydrogenase
MNQTSSAKQFAVVTGASSGIGYELAAEFARHGFDLLIAAEDDAIMNAQGKLAALGTEVEGVQVDLSGPEGVEELYQTAQALGRPIDAIAINAGVGVSGDFASETDLDAELNLINLNVTSSVHLSKLVLQDMVARGQGRILFTSSIAGVMPAPYEAVYGASKAFIKSFAEAIRHELKNTGVTVTTLMPGPTETNFFHRAGMDDTKVGADKKDDPAEVAREGFEALMGGKDHVVAGSFKNKLQATLAHVLPDTVTAGVHGRVAEPGSAER